LSFRAALAAVLAVALVVRLGVVVATDDRRLLYDAEEFDDIARSIADEGQYPPTSFARVGSPAALRPPAYPYLLGATYEVTGKGASAGQLVGALLGTVAVGLIALIALRLWGRTAAIAAGALAAAYPPLVMTNGSLLSEALFVPLVLGLVLVLLSGAPAARVAVLTGLLVGLATLTRPVGLLLLVAVFVWAWRLRVPARRRLVLGGLAAVTAVGTIVPWSVRNQAAFDTFVPISTQDGFNLAGTYNEESARGGSTRGTWRPPFIVARFRPLFGSELDEQQVNRRLRDDAIEYAIDHPRYIAEAAGLNTLRLVGLGPGHVGAERIWYAEMGIGEDAQPWVRWSVYLMVIAALAGVVLRRRALPAPLWLVPVLLFLSVVFIHGGPRYRVPLDPFLVLFAAATLTSLIERRRLQST
jgi:4-amino-4-deoxy-L-arabinose transferase-like glycosyltransferase